MKHYWIRITPRSWPLWLIEAAESYLFGIRIFRWNPCTLYNQIFFPPPLFFYTISFTICIWWGFGHFTNTLYILYLIIKWRSKVLHHLEITPKEHFLFCMNLSFLLLLQLVWQQQKILQSSRSRLIREEKSGKKEGERGKV